MYGAIAAAAISAAGSYLGGMQANSASARQATLNRAFQKYMSSTAHQREVEDMRKAGLNPILSGLGGQGASTPSGATAEQKDVVTPALSSAFSAYRSVLEADRTRAEADLTRAQAEKTRAEAENVPLTGENIAQNTSTAKASEELLKEQKTHEGFKIELTNTTKQYNQMLTDLVEKQKITEDLKQKLQNQDYEIGKAELAKAMTNQKIDNTTFGVIMRYVDRLLSLGSVLNATRPHLRR